MSFAALVSDMTAVIAEDLYDEAVYTVAGAAPVPCRAAIDEPIVDAVDGQSRFTARERRQAIWLLRSSVPAPVKGARIDVLIPGAPRSFIIDSQVHADPDRIKVAVREEVIAP